MEGSFLDAGIMDIVWFLLKLAVALFIVWLIFQVAMGILEKASDNPLAFGKAILLLALAGGIVAILYQSMENFDIESHSTETIVGVVLFFIGFGAIGMVGEWLFKEKKDYKNTEEAISVIVVIAFIFFYSIYVDDRKQKHKEAIKHSIITEVYRKDKRYRSLRTIRGAEDTSGYNKLTSEEQVIITNYVQSGLTPTQNMWDKMSEKAKMVLRIEAKKREKIKK